MAAAVRLPVALFGLPSVQSIVEGIVEFFFQDIAKALVPDFLKKASVASIKWLVAVPDPTAWPHVAQLESDMAALAGALLAVSFTAAIVRYLAVGIAGSGSPLQPLSSTVSSAAMIVGYTWAAHQTVAFVNALTGAILSFPVVGEGLQRTVGALFGGALLVGSGSLFFAVLAIVAVVFAAVMFAVKVLLLIGVAFVYVSGLLVIALRPLGETGPLARAWLSMVSTLALVPVGWTILFALAGALSLDATTLGSAGAGGLPAHLEAALAAVMTFYLAAKLPLAALSQLRSSLAGMASGAHSGSASAGSGSGGGRGVARVADAHARLRSGALQAGRAAGSAAGAVGAPAGGAVGAAARAAARLTSPVGYAAMTAATALTGRATGNGGSSSSSSMSAQQRPNAAASSTDSSRAAGSDGQEQRRRGAVRSSVARSGRSPTKPTPARPSDATSKDKTAGKAGARTGAGTGARPIRRAGANTAGKDTAGNGDAARPTRSSAAKHGDARKPPTVRTDLAPGRSTTGEASQTDPTARCPTARARKPRAVSEPAPGSTPKTAGQRTLAPRPATQRRRWRFRRSPSPDGR